MPPKLKELLESVTPEEADKIWEYLDGNEDAIDSMIDILIRIAKQQ